MRAIYLTDEELALMVEMLNEELPALHHEIHHTDARAMRDVLNVRLRTITQLAERLGEMEPPPLPRRTATGDALKTQ